MAKPKTDKAFLERLKRDAPKALEVDVDFDAMVTHVLRAENTGVAARTRRKRKRRKLVTNG